MIAFSREAFRFFELRRTNTDNNQPKGRGKISSMSKKVRNWLFFFVYKALNLRPILVSFHNKVVSTKNIVSPLPRTGTEIRGRGMGEGGGGVWYQLPSVQLNSP